MIQRLMSPLIFIWVVMVALIGMAVGVGYRLPSGDEMTYANISDGKLSNSVNIFLRDMSRGLEQQLTSDFGTNTLAKWSPDGKQIAYLSLIGSTFRVQLMDALGHHKHPLGVEFTTFDSTYIWSPNSQWILFSVTHEGVPQSLIVNLGTGEQHQLPQYIGTGMWSPDSQNILYEASTENGISHLYSMNIRCFEQESPCQFSELDFLDESANEIKPLWSPDGKKLAYIQFDADNSKLIVATLRCADLKPTCIESRKTIANISYLITPIWSADSKKLAFASSKTEIRISDLTSESIQNYPLNKPTLQNALQNWSPDGHYITFFANEDGRHAIILILDTVNGEIYPLFRDNQIIAISPSWKPVQH